MSLFSKSIPLLASTTVILAACGPKADAPPPPAAENTMTPPAAPEMQTPEGVTYAPALEVDLSKMTKDANDIYSRDLVVGTGAEAVTGKTVEMIYTGWLADGTKFDGNVGGAPYQVLLGAGRVIDGWDLGIVGMKVGGKRQLVIPPFRGYGAQGNGPIPGGAVLVFTVELMSVK